MRSRTSRNGPRPGPPSRSLSRSTIQQADRARRSSEPRGGSPSWPSTTPSGTRPRRRSRSSSPSPQRGPDCRSPMTAAASNRRIRSGRVPAALPISAVRRQRSAGGSRSRPGPRWGPSSDSNGRDEDYRILDVTSSGVARRLRRACRDRPAMAENKGPGATLPAVSKNLVIVESPAKARTIERYLGDDYRVLASYGHVRDLPENPGKGKFGVDVDHDFAPEYVISEDRRKQVADIEKAARNSDQVFLATDLDREGEAIAWHVAEAAH